MKNKDYSSDDDETLSTSSGDDRTISTSDDISDEKGLKSKKTAGEDETADDNNDAKSASHEDNDDVGKNENQEKTFSVGDHVYCWCDYLGVPRAYQHHGIVVDTNQFTGEITIVDFFLIVNEKDDRHDKKETPKRRGLRTESSLPSSGNSGFSGPGAVRESIISVSEAKTSWRKVRYGVSWIDHNLSWPGTSTTIRSDTLPFILARVDFLVENQTLIPQYDVLKCNCECVAFWCMTGKFCSLQGSIFLGKTAPRAAAGVSALGAATVATTTTTVPAAGIWGWLGYTTTVPLMTAAPWLLPSIAIAGIASTTTPLLISKACAGDWKRIGDSLNARLTGFNLKGMYLPHAIEFARAPNHD